MAGRMELLCSASVTVSKSRCPVGHPSRRGGDAPAVGQHSPPTFGMFYGRRAWEGSNAWLALITAGYKVRLNTADVTDDVLATARRRPVPEPSDQEPEG
jgi:hypothetical protein